MAVHTLSQRHAPVATAPPRAASAATPPGAWRAWCRRSRAADAPPWRPKARARGVPPADASVFVPITRCVKNALPCPCPCAMPHWRAPWAPAISKPPPSSRPRRPAAPRPAWDVRSLQACATRSVFRLFVLACVVACAPGADARRRGGGAGLDSEPAAVRADGGGAGAAARLRAGCPFPNTRGARVCFVTARVLALRLRAPAGGAPRAASLAQPARYRAAAGCGTRARQPRRGCGPACAGAARRGDTHAFRSCHF